jgi:DNA-binding NtrC family response regulator
MKTVLVVDDNEVLCRLACDILEMDGYRAVPACNAEEALEALERESFDVVVTDFRMPGMNGLELARVIQERNPGVPVIIMTAYGPIEAVEIRACLAKENLFPGLLEIIRLCLSEVEAPAPETCEQS